MPLYLPPSSGGVASFNTRVGAVTLQVADITSIDGSGSGIDADLLDGNHASAFALLASGPTFTGDITSSGGAFKSGTGAYASTAGDIGSSRNSSPTTGMYYMGNSGNSYLYFDGANYSFGNLSPNGPGSGMVGAGDFTLFSGAMNGDTLIPSVGMAAMANAAGITQSGVLNDHFAFNPPTTAETSTNGSTWSAATVPTGVFAGRPKQTWTGVGISQASPYLRFTWNSMGYRFYNYLLCACSTNGNNIRFILEYSSNGTSWTGWATSGWKGNWPGYVSFAVPGTPGGSNTYFRLTIQRDTANANSVDIGQLCFYGGYGSTNNLFDWDASKFVSFTGIRLPYGTWCLTDSNGAARLYFNNGGSTNFVSPDGAHYWGTGAGSSYQMSLLSGSLTTTGNVTAYGSVSDKRLKTNIRPVENALEKVSTLHAVTHEWDEEKLKGAGFNPTKGTLHGVIAQEIKEIMPDAVYEAKGEDGETYLGVRYERLTVLLLAAVKELSAEVKRLKENR